MYLFFSYTYLSANSDRLVPGPGVVNKLLVLSLGRVELGELV